MKTTFGQSNRFRRWSIFGAVLLFLIAGSVSVALAQALSGGTLDPTTIPKYVTPLVIPPVMKNTGTANDYDIAVRQFQQQILPGGIWNTINGRTDAFPATTVFSYGPAADPTPAVAPAANSQFNYPAYTVEATTNTTVKVDWINELVEIDPKTGFPFPVGTSQRKFLPHITPIDRSLHWANPEQLPCMDPAKTKDCRPDPANGNILTKAYTGPVPIVTHVHGAHVTPESDGYPEAWWLPNASDIPASYATRGTLVNQYGTPTNNTPGVGSYSYPNDQPSTTLWYHDHTLGMTRNNVYAGPAGFWLLRDPAAQSGETGLATYDATGAPQVLPGPAPVAGQGVLALNVPGDPVRASIREIPIVIQGRSFNKDGSLYYPAERAFFENINVSKLKIPFIGDDKNTPSDISAIWNPEFFGNTMVVNGGTWPTLEVEPDLYRFRLLNGCDSRFLNLSMFVVDPVTNDVFDVNGNPTQEIPIYQIGAEQSLLPNVVQVKTGFKTVLPGDGTIPAATPAAASDEALLMGLAERADVIVDFTGFTMPTRIRMINTAPDAPFGGFGDIPSDPGTTGQVMEFTLVSDNMAVGEGFTAPQNLVLTPVENVDTYPAGLPNVNPIPRDLALLEEESSLICVTVTPTGKIDYDKYSTPDPNTPETCIDNVTGAPAASVPMAPKAAVLGIDGKDGGTVTLWSDPIVTNPAFNATETWELWNWTVDGHPIHLHLVKFKVVDREAIDPDTGLGDGISIDPSPTEAGWKDTVIAYPGEITRVKSTFDIAGLYVWHCHIVSHEDNEMMVPYCVGDKATAPGCDVVP